MRARESACGGGSSSEKRWLDCFSSIFVGGIGRDCDERVIRLALNCFDTIVDIFIPKKVRCC